jgi:hypothetical protein
MPEEQRKRLRDMRLSAAARGVRVPDPSVPLLNCPWLNAVIEGIARLLRVVHQLKCLAWAPWSKARPVPRAEISL